MFWIILLVVFLFTYPVWRHWIPKGNLIQEIISLPNFWGRLLFLSTDRMKISKHRMGNHRRQYLLCCEPISGKRKTQNVIVYYHGGGWMFGSPEQFQASAQVFVDLGYTVFLPSYRRVPFHGYTEINEDLDNAILKVQELKKELDLSDARLILGGMSAGGNVAGLIVFDRSRIERLKLPSNIFSGIFLCGAPLNLNGMYDSLLLYWFAGKRNAVTFTQASPSSYLQAEETIPFCCIHGTKDGMVPFPAANLFIEDLKIRHNGILDYKIIDGGTHLEAITWVYQDDSLRVFLLNWLKKSNLD